MLPKNDLNSADIHIINQPPKHHKTTKPQYHSLSYTFGKLQGLRYSGTMYLLADLLLRN